VPHTKEPESNDDKEEALPIFQVILKLEVSCFAIENEEVLLGS